MITNFKIFENNNIIQQPFFLDIKTETLYLSNDVVEFLLENEVSNFKTNLNKDGNLLKYLPKMDRKKDNYAFQNGKRDFIYTFNIINSNENLICIERNNKIINSFGVFSYTFSLHPLMFKKIDNRMTLVKSIYNYNSTNRSYIGLNIKLMSFMFPIVSHINLFRKKMQKISFYDILNNTLKRQPNKWKFLDIQVKFKEINNYKYLNHGIDSYHILKKANYFNL
jgi:hypothetical protein